ncbi:MAG: riboflavin kinase/FMN adenylyltransferase [Candidatus Midichloriaceae bacterium]|jgi:riboflavin kinase/FMN adenylyltransferase|nr:riboflavin kinase/FMN adenylyltransferase [Candidatus Midichloriaceae bacterium]
MIIFGYDNIPKEFLGAAIAIGNFDGVHVGHQEIIKTALSIARRKGCKAGVLTFDPHPNIMLGKDHSHTMLMQLEERAKKIMALGVDFVVVAKFTPEFSSLSASEFIQTVLQDSLKANHIVTGYNFRFGSKGSGDVRYLAKMSGSYGFSFTGVNHIKYLNYDVSSSYIKALIIAGRTMLAAKLLGEPYKIPGPIVKGKQVAGSVLGTPTANINFSQDTTMPLFGVYLVKTAGNWGVANIGWCRGTQMDEPKTPMLEVHLFDLESNDFVAYGKHLEVELFTLMRPERKFNELSALKYAIEADKVMARYLLRNNIKGSL